MTKAIITGVTAFAGSHLADYLLDEVGVEVHGIRRPRSRDEFTRRDIVYHEADICDLTGLIRILREVKPDFVFHLAAQSFVPLSWQAPASTMQTNVIGTQNVLEAVRECGNHAVVQFAGSSEEYGLVLEGEAPIKETNPLRPMSPYGVSKVAGDLSCQQYHMSYGIKTIVTRAFNHTGPRRGEQFVTSSFAKQIAMIEHGATPVINVGDLTSQRDWTDARDTVRAYWLIANKGVPGQAYNVCTGKAWTVRQMLDILLSLSTRKDIEVREDKTRLRPSDVPLLLGDCSKLKSVCEWEPKIDFHITMMDLLAYWRAKCERGDKGC